MDIGSETTDGRLVRLRAPWNQLVDSLSSQTDGPQKISGNKLVIEKLYALMDAEGSQKDSENSEILDESSETSY